MAGSLQDAIGASLCAGHDAFHRGALANEALAYVQLGGIHVEIVLCVGNCAAKQFDEVLTLSLHHHIINGRTGIRTLVFFLPSVQSLSHV